VPPYEPGGWIVPSTGDPPAPPRRACAAKAGAASIQVLNASGWRKGDVIVFRQGGRTLVKRVTALPGETFPPEALRNPERDKVPPGRLFVMGDNREHSEDSRDFGPVPIRSVIGRVLRWNQQYVFPFDELWRHQAG